MRKIFCFTCVCLWILGTIGGAGYALHSGAALIAAGVLALGAMAAPYAYDRIKELTA